MAAQKKGEHVSSQPGSVVAAHFARDAGAVAASVQFYAQVYWRGVFISAGTI